ncbi:hypothetical protein, partial [Sporosarcina sp. USHLN248]|uniref:hypothetical protein n=1 Tax=Sporosarcina sp. USHLN248 TaxID=3081300 RepID=UPI00301A6C8B
VKMSILNPKIRFVSSADGVGFETLFVDVLLFSFQGSFTVVFDGDFSILTLPISIVKCFRKSFFR